ncbi:hypothetical protein [Mycoplasmopsis cynos]|uniref:hypothetical protein n=1 Tax=Mycoplasmopsis cynos TaxID=171284 RepID=UPI0024C7C799|nr:hypothetical protein [Mycoplasmopsis cynos]WAM07510.1 hypothetical protein ONA21_05105 [Mycoplasmopsis cynos]
MFEGTNTFGFLPVYGIAPSEMNDRPNKIFEYFPDSSSSLVHNFLLINIDNEIPSGAPYQKAIITRHRNSWMTICDS